MAVVKMDSDWGDLTDFRYNTLVKTFGKEEADRILAEESGEEVELPKEVSDTLENAPDWEDE